MNTAHPFVRLTVNGGAKAADVVLPMSQTPQALLPELLTLLEVRDAPTRYDLFTAVGQRLRGETPLAEQGLYDGQQLSLLPVADAPAEPLVHDVVDRVVGHRGRGLWNPRTSQWVYGALTALLMLTGAWFIPGTVGMPWIPLGGFLVLSAATAWAGSRALGWSFFGAAAVVALAGPFVAHIERPFLTWWIPLIAAMVLAVGALTDRIRAAFTGVLTFAGLLAVAWLCVALGTNPREEAAAITAVVALGVVGLIPRIALAGAGLYRIADGVADGDEYRAAKVDHAVADTYASLTATTFLVSVVLGACLVSVAPHALTSEFAAIALAAIGIATLVRTRHFPGAVHRLAMFAAVLAGAVSLCVAITHAVPGSAVWIGVAAIALALALVAAPFAVHTSPVNKAQGRRIAGIVEKVCVLLTVPAVVGMFGVFRDLLRTFQ